MEIATGLGSRTTTAIIIATLTPALATPTAPTPTPEPTAQITIVSAPSTAESGTTVTIVFKVTNSITGAPMAVVSVGWGAGDNQDGTVTSNANGIGTASFMAPVDMIGNMTSPYSMYAFGTSSYYGSTASGSFLLTPV